LRPHEKATHFEQAKHTGCDRGSGTDFSDKGRSSKGLKSKKTLDSG